MKIILLLCAILIFGVLNSCSKISKVEEELGDTKIITIKNDDTPNINLLYYYNKNNKLYMTEKRFLDNNIKYFSTFYETGRKKAKYRTDDGYLTGTYYFYYDNKANSLKGITYFNKGDENGIQIEYFESGRVAVKSFYEYGRLDSIFNYNDDKVNSLNCKHTISHK